MLKMLFIFILVVVVVPQPGAGASKEIPLWPEIEPFETGYLRVSELHEIYY